MMNSVSNKEEKTLPEKEKILVTSIFFFSHNVFKSLLLEDRKKSGIVWGKGLKKVDIIPFPNDNF